MYLFDPGYTERVLKDNKIKRDVIKKFSSISIWWPERKELYMRRANKKVQIKENIVCGKQSKV